MRTLSGRHFQEGVALPLFQSTAHLVVKSDGDRPLPEAAVVVDAPHKVVLGAELPGRVAVLVVAVGEGAFQPVALPVRAFEAGLRLMGDGAQREHRILCVVVDAVEVLQMEGVGQCVAVLQVERRLVVGVAVGSERVVGGLSENVVLKFVAHADADFGETVREIVVAAEEVGGLHAVGGDEVRGVGIPPPPFETVLRGELLPQSAHLAEAVEPVGGVGGAAAGGVRKSRAQL